LNYVAPESPHGLIQEKYANDAWMIFIKGKAAQVEPEDHALNHYHDWYMREMYASNAA